MYLLRELNSFSVSGNILLTFYYSFIESVLSRSICCRYHSITLQNRNCLHNIVKNCSKIIGFPARHLRTVYEQQDTSLARQILDYPMQALVPAFESCHLVAGSSVRPLRPNKGEQPLLSSY
ncbi:hypothetical protein ATANTOWER_012294 [Ataeniobius toweri]|uniref:Uncharacterized protein n=1 Tax=Ataeniobius toweri TaxID=208326 RepID=A0ABU7B6Q5_9TELE|nr:hypothetical protein [Ataeniobius toweri]